MSANPPRHIVAHVPGSHSVVSTTSCQQLLTKAHPFPPGLAFWCNIAMSLAVRWSISEVTSNEWDEAIDDVFDAREVIIHLSVCDAFPSNPARCPPRVAASHEGGLAHSRWSGPDRVSPARPLGTGCLRAKSGAVLPSLTLLLHPAPPVTLCRRLAAGF